MQSEIKPFQLFCEQVDLFHRVEWVNWLRFRPNCTESENPFSAFEESQYLIWAAGLVCGSDWVWSEDVPNRSENLIFALEWRQNDTASSVAIINLNRCMM